MKKEYRLRVRNVTDTADDFIISSKVGDSNLYLESPPRGDGQKVNVITGNVDVGSYQVPVIDTGVSPVNVVTSKLYDAGKRITLLNRRAYNEIAVDGGGWLMLSAGYISAIRLTDPGLFVFTIGDTRRTEQTFELFRSIIKTNRDGTETTLRLNRATSFIGGPVEGGFAATRDHGGWRFRVEEKYGGINIVRLRFEYGWYPTNQGYKSVAGWSGMPVAESIRLLTAFKPYQVNDGRYWTQLQVRYAYPRIRAKIFNEAGALLAMVPVWGSRGSESSVLGRGDLLVDWAAAPAVATKVYVYLYPVDISPFNPLHLNGHPADIIGDMWADSGIPYDPASITTSRAAIGSDLRVGLRFNEPQKLVDVERSIFGLFGLGTRIDSTGRRVMFSTRVKASASPSLSVTYADLREDMPELFNTSESQIINRVIVKQQGFQEWSNPGDVGFLRVIDGDYFNHMDFVMEVPQTAEVEYEDPASYGVRDVTYELNGYIYNAAAQSGLGYLPGGTQLPIDLYARGIAGEIFDRFGRGPVEIPLKFKDSFTGQLGDEFILTAAHYPNSNNVRGGTRTFQVVQRTETVAGPDIVALDSGENVQASVVPTFTLAANTNQPRNVVDITLTNAAALVAAGLFVRYQFAVSATTPADDGTLLATLDPSLYTSVSSPLIDGGSKVYVKARSELYGRRPSAWSSWANVTLTALPTVSSLTKTTIGPSEYDLAWTNGDTTGQYLVDVLLRATATETTRVIDTLPPGSTKYRLNLKDNSTAYDWGIRLRESPPLNGVSATITDSVTTGTKTALAAPTNIRSFSGLINAPAEGGDRGGMWPKRDGIYGADVEATVIPSATEFYVAPETSVGSNTPGTYVLAATITSKASGKTYFMATAPNDGLRRYMYARHMLEHREPSGPTAVVNVFPWVPTKPVDEGIAVPGDVAVAVVYSISDKGEEARLRVTFTRPLPLHFALMGYKVQSRPAGSAAAYGAETLVLGTQAGPDLIPAEFSTQYQITPFTETLESRTHVFGTPVVTTVSARTDPTPSYGTPIATSSYIEYPTITYDTETKYIVVWSKLFTSSPDASSMENAPGAAIATTLNKGDGRTLLQLSVDATNIWRKTTFVPYDKDGNRGPVTTLSTQRATPSAPAAPASAASQSNPNPGTGVIINRVTLGAGAVAGWKIRTYRGGVAYGTDRTLVAGDITAGYVDITDSGVALSTAYSYEYSTINATGIESTTKTTPLVVTTFAGGTIPTPSVTDVERALSYHTIYWSPGGGSPAGLTAFIEQRTPSGSGSWVAVGTTTDPSYVYGAQSCPSTREYRVTCSKVGYTTSAPSSGVAGECTSGLDE